MFPPLLSKIRNPRTRYYITASPFLCLVLTSSLKFIFLFQLLWTCPPGYPNLTYQKQNSWFPPNLFLLFSSISSHLLLTPKDSESSLNPLFLMFFIKPPICLFPHSRPVWPLLISITVNAMVWATIMSWLNCWGKKYSNWSFCFLSSLS